MPVKIDSSVCARGDQHSVLTVLTLFRFIAPILSGNPSGN